MEPPSETYWTIQGAESDLLRRPSLRSAGDGRVLWSGLDAQGRGVVGCSDVRRCLWRDVVPVQLPAPLASVACLGVVGSALVVALRDSQERTYLYTRLAESPAGPEWSRLARRGAHQPLERLELPAGFQESVAPVAAELSPSLQPDRVDWLREYETPDDAWSQVVASDAVPGARPFEVEDDDSSFGLQSVYDDRSPLKCGRKVGRESWFFENPAAQLEVRAQDRRFHCAGAVIVQADSALAAVFASCGTEASQGRVLRYAPAEGPAPPRQEHEAWWDMQTHRAPAGSIQTAQPQSPGQPAPPTATPTLQRQPSAAGAAPSSPPPVPTRSRRLAWAYRGAGLLVLAAVLLVYRQLTSIEHQLARYSSELSARDQTALRDRVLGLGTREELLPHVSRLEDPALRGSFHEVLVSGGDPVHVPAILVFAQGEVGGDDWEGILKSLRTYEDDVVLPALFSLQEIPQLQDRSQMALEANFSAEALLPYVLELEDPARRGRFHTALASSGDAAQAEAILAYAEQRAKASDQYREQVERVERNWGRPSWMPDVREVSEAHQWGTVVDSLIELCPEATPQVRQVLESGHRRDMIELAALVMREVDLSVLMEFTTLGLDLYDRRYAELAQASQYLQQHDPNYGKPATSADLIIAVAGVKPPPPSAQVLRARAVVEEASERAFRIVHALKALRGRAWDDARIERCFLRGLSTFDEAVAKYCARALHQRLSPEALVGALFVYIAKKTEFRLAEVKVYEDLILELESEVVDEVAVNLARLLQEAGGRPEGVFWIYKRIGFRTLGAKGTPAALPVLEAYLEDEGTYEERGDGPQSGRSIRHADECRAAIEAIQARG